MPIAAVPNYLGQDFKDASPGMRFGLYLQLWGTDNRTNEMLWTTHDVNYRVAGKDGEERAFKDENKVDAIKEAQKLTTADCSRMKAVFDRQQAAFVATALPNASLQLVAQSTAPFTTGLGNEHPLENGFAFLNPYGLPYLPGSGIKGVLRQAARELASGEWGDTHGWSAEKTIEITIEKKHIPISMIDVLFGLESKDGEKEHLRGALSFWDVMPQIKGDHLTVEIMTPHQSHYYQEKQDKKSGDSMSPHDSGSPNPISFLTVPPESGFTFFITCDTALLARHAPQLMNGEDWKNLLQAAFIHAFEWLGFGAKTTVGYGAMQMDQKALQAQRKAAEAKAIADARAQMTEAQRAIAEYVAYMTTRHEELRGKPNRIDREYQETSIFSQKALTSPDWSVEDKQAAAEAILEWLPKVVQVDMKKERKKLKIAQLLGNSSGS